jgi:hypothetical protein
MSKSTMALIWSVAAIGAAYVGYNEYKRYRRGRRGGSPAPKALPAPAMKTVQAEVLA